jgi:hypothetical protein
MQVLFELCRFRNHHPAFNGKFELLDTVQDIKESVVLLPPTAPSPAVPMSTIPSGLSPTTSGESINEILPGASGSLVAQTKSLRASMAGEESNFLAEMVLDKSDVKVLAAVDPEEAAKNETEWCVFVFVFSYSPSCVFVCFLFPVLPSDTSCLFYELLGAVV